jgi:hypothetical protein
MVLCMVFCLSTPAFADNTEAVCNCRAGEGSPHLETCPVYVAPAPVFCDGSVKWLPAATFTNYIWRP